MKALRWIVVVLTLVLAAALTMLNVQPYLSMSAKLLEAITDVPFLDFLMLIPIVSSVLSLLSRIAADAFGVALWGVLQLLQILPAIMRGDLKILSIFIRGLGEIPQMTAKEGDSEIVAELKEQYNKAPSEWFKRALTLSIVAYGVDLVLCFLHFPPYKGGPLVFWEDVQMGVQSFESIDWVNLQNAVFTLFGFELILTFAIWIAQGLALFGRRRRPAPQPPNTTAQQNDQETRSSNYAERARRARRVYQN